jgi:inhibitor of cysteine peptidase
MKRILVLVTLVAIGAFAVAGCASGIGTYTDPGQAISVGVDREFIIALDSNPTTDFSWQEDYDNSMLELTKKTYEQAETGQEPMVGVGGVEYFQFKALKAGTTKITMDYKRPWEEEAVEQKVFVINIA